MLAFAGDPGSRDPHHRVIGQAADRVSIGRPVGPRLEQVADAQEAGHEPGLRSFVEILRRAELLVATLVHDGDAIGHRHRLLLVVRHVDEGDADLLLDALELDLHLLAQLEVEGAERLVEEQDGRPVDERARQRDALRLAAGDLVGLALVEALAARRARASRPRALRPPRPRRACARRPKATFSKMERCGKRA